MSHILDRRSFLQGGTALVTAAVNKSGAVENAPQTAMKLPPPGVLRVVCLEDGRVCAKLLANMPSAEAVVQSFRGDLSKNPGAGIWESLPKVKAFLPHVVVTSFPQTGDYQALIDELIAYPSGPRVLICPPAGVGEGAASVRELAAANWPKNVRLAEPGPALLAAVREARQKPEDGLVIRGNERTLEAADRAYSEIPPVEYMPPADRFKLMPRARSILEHGGTLRVLMLGDSIINDNSRSAWDLMLMRERPKVRIVKFTSVRGGGGCWWFKEPGRIQTFVLDHAPDLVIIGGISQRDCESIRDCVGQIRLSANPDFLFLTGPFGTVNPNDGKQWREALAVPYREQLKTLACEMGAEFFDLQMEWGRYVIASGKEVSWFMRDPVHANERGEQIIGRILERYLVSRP